jgi:IS605 OrfB family transposase
VVRLDRDIPYPQGQVRSVMLLYDGERLQVDVTAEVPVAAYPDGRAPDPARVAGVDLGVIHPYAVSGPGGDALLVSGRAIRAEHRQHLRDVKARQKAAARRAPKQGQRGSRRWRKHRRSQRKAQNRYARRVRQAAHEAARQVIIWAARHQIGTLVLGDPRGVLDLPAGRVHNKRLRDWAPGRAIAMLRDKAEAAGITVVLVNERGTSSTCPACARRVPKPPGRVFTCPRCGLTGHRDLVAAAIIAVRASGGGTTTTKPAAVPVRVEHRRAGTHLPGVHPARRDPRRRPPSRPAPRSPTAGTGPPRSPAGSRSPSQREAREHEGHTPTYLPDRCTSIARVAVASERAPGAVQTRMLACAYFLLAAVVLTLRLWRDPASRIVTGNPGDADQFAWFMRHGAMAVSHWRLPALVTAGMNAPQGVNLMWNPSLLLPSVVLAPVTLLAGPQVALNVLLTAGFAGSAASMFWVLRRWGCGGGAAFAGGLVYGFSPALTHSAVGHYDLQFAVFPPLIADAALTLLTGRARPVRCGIWLGVLLAAQLLTDEELLFDTVAAVAILAVALAASRPRAVAGRLRDVATGAGACAAAFAMIAGYPLREQFFGPLRQYGATFTADFFKNDLNGFVQPSSLLLVHSRSSAAFAAAFQGGPSEYLGYLGWPMLAVLLGVAVAFWRLVAIRVTTVALVVLAVFSLGGTLLIGGHDHNWLKLPWYWLQTLPVAESVLPSRFSIIADGAAAALFAFGVDAAWRRWSPAPARYAVGLVAAAAMVPLIPAPLPAVNVPAAPAGWTASLRALRLPAGAQVLTVPIPTATFTEPMRWQADTGTPSSLVGGYFIGPASNGHAYVGGSGLPAEAQYLNRLWLESAAGPVPDGIPASGPVPAAAQMRQQIANWDPAAVIAVTSPNSPLGAYLITLLGQPSASTADVLGWRLPPGH